MRSDSEHGGSDLGRRIIEHRNRAGLSRDETAEKAGMAENYLAYLETSDNPNVTQATLARLSAALGSSASVLAGAGLSRPPGQSGPGTRPLLDKLSAAECRDYLAAGGVGRFVFLDARGPVAVPVNYRMLGGDIVFRTGAHTSLAEGAQHQPVSFEVDHLDDALSEGWSVLVSGAASLVTEPAELTELRSLGVAPWAGGDREVYVRMAARDISGRRIRLTGEA